MSEHHDGQLVLARREFLKTTGVVIVAFSIGGKSRAQTAAPAMRRGPVSGPPDRNAVDSYIAIHADNTATLYAGYASSAKAGPQRCCKSRPRNWISTSSRSRPQPWTRTCRRTA